MIKIQMTGLMEFLNTGVTTTESFIPNNGSECLRLELLQNIQIIDEVQLWVILV